MAILKIRFWEELKFEKIFWHKKKVWTLTILSKKHWRDLKITMDKFFGQVFFNVQMFISNILDNVHECFEMIGATLRGKIGTTR